MHKISKTNLVLIGSLLFFIASPAFASSNAGQVAQGVFGQLSSFASVITAVVFLAGLGVGAGAAFKFKAHSEDARSTPLKVPMMWAIVAALLIGFPAYLNVSKSTLFGNQAGNSMEETAYQSIGGRG